MAFLLLVFFQVQRCGLYTCYFIFLHNFSMSPSIFQLFSPLKPVKLSLGFPFFMAAADHIFSRSSLFSPAISPHYPLSSLCSHFLDLEERCNLSFLWPPLLTWRISPDSSPLARIPSFPNLGGGWASWSSSLRIQLASLKACWEYYVPVLVHPFKFGESFQCTGCTAVVHSASLL